MIDKNIIGYDLIVKNVKGCEGSARMTECGELIRFYLS